MIAASLLLAAPMRAFQGHAPAPSKTRESGDNESQPRLESAQKALLEGQADVASTTLNRLLATDSSNGSAHLLLCRVWLSEGFPDRSVPECQAALANGLGNSSAAQDWTGRALGRQAEHAGIISGLRLALQVRTAFETAVQLSPDSEPACVDLGEYYTAAPAIVGGGKDKALALATRIERTLPAVSHRIRAMVAEKDEEYRTAEAEFQAEARVGNSPGTTVDLACFYQRRQQGERASEIARQTIEKDREIDSTVIEAASILEDEHQTDMAKATMRHYIDRGTHSDTAPVFRVHALLGKLLAHDGDTQAAREQYRQALAMASQFKPAQKGLASL